MMQTVYENPPGAAYDQMPPMNLENQLFVHATNHRIGSGGETLVHNETSEVVHLEIGQIAMWSRGEAHATTEMYRTIDGRLARLTRDANGNLPDEVLRRFEKIRENLRRQGERQSPTASYDLDGEVLSSFEHPQRERLITKAGRFLKSLMFKKNPAASYAGKRRAPENRDDQTRPHQNSQSNSRPRQQASRHHRAKHRK